MPETMTQGNGVAPLANVAALATLIERCLHRRDGLPGMGCFFGRAGRGKTSAATWCAIKYDAVHVQAISIGGTKFLLEMIVSELGLKHERTTVGMLQQVCRALAVSGRPLIIDEADKILRTGQIEVLRAIFDQSGVPVILMGEEELPQRLVQWERVHSRILWWEGAQEATVKDVDVLAGIYAPGIALDADLKARVLARSGGSLRYVSTSLAMISEHAATRGLSRITLADWGDRPLHSGEAPMPRNAPSRPRLGTRGRAA